MSEILIPDYENYSINNLGQVKNLKTGKILKHRIDTEGYYYVSLCKNGKVKNFLVHKLLTKLFLGINGGVIDHIDGNKKNNSLDNLRAATLSENQMNRKSRGYTIKLKENKKKEIVKYYQAQIGKNGKQFTFCSYDLYKVIMWRSAKEIELFREFAHKIRKCSVKILSDN